MLTKQLLIVIAVFFLAIVSAASFIRTFAYEEPDVLLTAGQKIDAFDAAMKRFGYSETMVGMRSFEKNHTLRAWDVYQGVLVAAYSRDTKTVSGISYLLEDKSDKLGKVEATSFLFEVRNFNPKAGELNIVLKEAPKAN